MTNNIIFRKCTLKDLRTLKEFSIKTYYDSFAHLNTEEDMKAYLDKAFADDKLISELSNPESEFYFLFSSGSLAGYLKLNEGKAQSDIKDPDSLEIERIYISGEFQGKGLGNALMDKAIKEATERKKEYIWLGVWEKNSKAINFYKKLGFFEAGTHPFIMGEDIQRDYIMRKDL